MAKRLIAGISMNDIAMALGGATSGFILGLVPIPDFGLVGAGEIILGWAGQKFIGKSGAIRAYFKGIMIAGISNLIASFIPQVSGTFPSGKKALQYNGPQGVHAQTSQYPRRGIYTIRSQGS